MDQPQIQQQQPPQPTLVKQSKSKSSNIFELLKNPIVWMVIGIASLVIILIFFVLFFVWKSLTKESPKQEVDLSKNRKKQPKPKPKEDEQRPAEQQQPQPTAAVAKKEEIIAAYTNSAPDVKVEASETSKDEDESPKIEEIA